MLFIYYFIFIFLLLWIMLTLIWYYKPELLLNIKYEITTDLKIENIEGPVLFLATHTDVYNDLILICGESRKSKNTVNIISRKIPKSNIEGILQSIPFYTSYNKLLVEENKKNNTVEKCKEKIKNNENILIFLKENCQKSGFYNILKETKIPIVFCRMNRKGYKITDMKSKNLNENYGNQIILEYEIYKNYDLNIEKDKFIKNINDKLYLK